MGKKTGFQKFMLDGELIKHEAKLDRNEMSMLRWMCCFNLKDNKKNTRDQGTVGT